MRADEAFVPLAVWLRGPVAAEPAPGADEPAPRADEPSGPVPDDTTSRACSACAGVAANRADALRDLRLFRARLADALEAATGVLVRELAYAVVGRELRLAPADVAALAARILADHPSAAPAALRCAPGDERALRLARGDDAGVPLEVDPALSPGDLTIVFAGGWVDARLGVRLDAVLEAWS